MSRLRKSVVPFSWATITANFTQGTAASVNVATYLSNPQSLTVTYSVVGSLQTGVTFSGSTLTYDGAGAAANSSVQFRATSGQYVADSAVVTVRINAIVVANQPPVWSGSDPINLTPTPLVYGAGGVFPLAGYASDVDGPATLTFGRTGGANDTAPGSVTVGSVYPANATFPASLAAGTYTIEVYAEDGYGLVPQVTGLTVTNYSQTVIALAWNDLAAESGYEVERSLNGTTFVNVASLSADVLSYSDTGLTADTLYYYRVRGVNSTGTGAYSSIVSQRTQAATVTGAAADWLNRSTAAGVVFAQRFSTDADVSNYRTVSNGTAAQAAAYIRRNATDGIIGDGCLEWEAPPDTTSYGSWWRPFNPNATSYASGAGGYYFGYDSAQGAEYYVQIRIKLNAARLNTSVNAGYKIFWVGTLVSNSLTSQEIVMSEDTSKGNRLNVYGGGGAYGYSAVAVASGDNDWQAGSQYNGNLGPGVGAYCDRNGVYPNACWFYPADQWVTYLFRVKGAAPNTAATEFDCWVVENGAYVRIVHRTDVSIPGYDQVNGWQALICSGYENVRTSGPTGQITSYDQIIVSKQPIAVPLY